jgi:hypothetical protein
MSTLTVPQSTVCNCKSHAVIVSAKFAVTSSCTEYPNPGTVIFNVGHVTGIRVEYTLVS